MCYIHRNKDRLAFTEVGGGRGRRTCIQAVMLVSDVNFTEFRITWHNCLWACLWEIILIASIEVKHLLLSVVSFSAKQPGPK